MCSIRRGLTTIWGLTPSTASSSLAGHTSAGGSVGAVCASQLARAEMSLSALAALSVTTLDRKLARLMEPRASTPAKRLEALKAMSDAGIPTAILASPMIPAINDMELERILDAAAPFEVVIDAAGQFT